MRAEVKMTINLRTLLIAVVCVLLITVIVLKLQKLQRTNVLHTPTPVRSQSDFTFHR